ncbi:RICIN domain-containing protein [Kribbella sp. NPDC026611]|uniref:RICIN domain-containing protein n=1 Tax=Kribbella sp. NPDC026611 TaxID=3154911 RepID=UPI0033D193DB
MKRILGVVACLLLALNYGAGPATALKPLRPATQSADAYELKNKNSGMCLAVPNGSTVRGAKLIQWPCGVLDPTGSRQFDWAGDEWEQIHYPAQRELLCLAVPNGSETSGVQVITWTCGSGNEQLWNHQGISIDVFDTIVNYKSRQCLAVSGGSKARGAAVIQWPCNGKPEQQWAQDF